MSRSPGNRGKNRGGTPPAEHRFKPGQSGNPSGRPKARPITDEYAAVLVLPLPDRIRRQLDLAKGATWATAIAIGTARSAVKGNHGAAKEMREALEGKSTQPIELSADGAIGVTVIDVSAIPRHG